MSNDNRIQVLPREIIMGDMAAVVFVIDNDPSMRAAIENLVGSVDLAVRLFASPQQFLASPRPDAPACLVLDVRLPGMSGLTFQKELARMGLDLPVVFITGHGDVRMSVRAMKAGAVDFLIKPFQDQDLLDAIHAAIARDRERRRDAVLVAELRERYATLTARERQIMMLVVVGRANKQIAAVLALSEMTVKVHRGQVMRKMQAGSLPELVRIADRLTGACIHVAGNRYQSRSTDRHASPEFVLSGG
jgi:FixJ family two-component response regulator